MFGNALVQLSAHTVEKRIIKLFITASGGGQGLLHQGGGEGRNLYHTATMQPHNSVSTALTRIEVGWVNRVLVSHDLHVMSI